jgi:DinB superfamily
MALNPYAQFLGDRSPWDVIDETTPRLKTLLDGLGMLGVEQEPAPGKWSARQIVCHLADCEIVFAFRLRQAMTRDHHVIDPFDQNLWATLYHPCDADTALTVFAAVRRWNIRLIFAMSPADLEIKVTHPERGEMTLQVVLETIAGHDLNHLAQIEAIAAAV